MARNTPKPGIDWAEVERRVQDGESYRAIEASLPGDAKLSHQAISKRARKEGWSEEQRLAIVAQSFKVANGNGKNTVERKLKILESLAKGAPFKVACGALGVAENTGHLWKREDVAFAAECEAAEWSFVQRNLHEVDKAAARGDWKAAVWMLGKHPRSKGDYLDDTSKAGATINIHLNIPKPTAAPELEPATIDVTPTKEHD